MYAYLSAIIVSAISLFAALGLAWQKQLVKRLSVAFLAVAAGSFIGDAFFHLLPEAIELQLEQGLELQPLMLATVVGIISFFLLEKAWHWHHHDLGDNEHNHTLAISNLLGDGLHNLLDGVAIAASFQLGVEVGVATTIAIILHEIPQELADFGILIHSGMKASRAILFNFLSGLTSVLGVFLFQIFSAQFSSSESIILAFLAGVFLYIATADLLVEIRKKERHWVNVVQIVGVLLGIGMMVALSLVE